MSDTTPWTRSQHLHAAHEALSLATEDAGNTGQNPGTTQHVIAQSTLALAHFAAADRKPGQPHG